MIKQNTRDRLTLGSLFDGIGGFPYAASFFGIEALWASEILPVAISVTKRHLPRMEHVGDITKLRSGELLPVDIITFGSPCQGLSAAGKRKGFSDPRSGLFSEAIRIITEMREATNGQYPTWAVWENVPGALSSNGGLDFRAVLEAFTDAEIPFPRSGRWRNTGMVRGGKAHIAWCVYNAQYFGTAQRRRRIFLVADFGGERSGGILFIPKSLQGYFEAGGTPRQGPAAYALRSSDGAVPDGCGVNCLNPWDTQQSRVFTDDGASPTLAGADGGGGRNPAGLVFAAFMGDSSASSFGVEYSEDASPTLKPRLSGTPCLCEPQIARTLMARGDSSPCADRGVNIVAMPVPDILCAATGQPNAEMLDNLSVTLTCQHEQPIICGAVGVHQNQSGDVNTADTAYSLATNGNATGRNAPLVCHPGITGTLCASGAGLSRPAGLASETDLCVVVPSAEAIPIQDKATRYSGGGETRKDDGAGNGLGVGKEGDPAPTLTSGDRHAVAAYCLQGNMIGRADHNGPRGDGINEEISFTLTATDVAAVAAVDCRNFREEKEISGTLQSKGTSAGYSLNCQNPVRLGYIVRRLTPTECERLQGYPDGWTAFTHDGKPISDTSRYMLLGNSVAVPCVAYILMGIAAAHRKEDD